MKHVLLVNDHQQRSLDRKLWLERSGFRVELVDNPESALDALEKHRADVVLADTLLSGINGFELCRKIRHRFDSEELPIALFDGIYRGATFEQVAAEAGAQAFIDSRVDRRDLVAAVVSLTRGERIPSAGPDRSATDSKLFFASPSPSS